MQKQNTTRGVAHTKLLRIAHYCMSRVAFLDE